MKRFLAGALAGVVSAAMFTVGALAAGAISGAGATFPYPIYSKWAAAYQKATGIAFNYQAIGSGGGISQIKAKTVTFGATDMPLKPADLDAAGLAMFPTVIGAEVIVYNLPGIASGTLTIDGPTLAGIYQGKITKWDAPELKALNPKVKLPSTPIIVVHRSDGSGTTFIFANYLSKVSKDWADNVGAATAIQWPVGVGSKGNEGVAGSVAQSAGAIGYVEYAYAMQNKLAWMKMKNHDGKVVAPSMAAFLSTASHADWDHADHFYMILTDQPGAASWPIENPTFVLFYKNPPDAATSAQALAFFKWSYANGGQMAKDLFYIPLPDPVVKKIQASWKGIKGSGA